MWVLSAIGADLTFKDQSRGGHHRTVQFHGCVVGTFRNPAGFEGVGDQIEIKRAALQGGQVGAVVAHGVVQET